MMNSKVVTPAERQRPPAAGRGRTKGVPNKVTREFRETVSQLLTDNADNVGLWLKQVAEGGNGKAPDPGKALDLLVKLAEFVAPKLVRSEYVDQLGGAAVEQLSTVELARRAAFLLTVGVQIGESSRPFHAARTP